MLFKKGFSLVELMVAVAIMGGLALGLMKITTMQSKQSKRSEQMLDGFQLFSTITSTLLNSEACRLSLKDTVINGSSVDVVGGSVKNSNGQSLTTVGNKIGAVRLDSLKIVSTSGVAANSVGVVNLEVALTRLGVGGTDEQKVTKKFGLNVTVDGAQKVTGCYSDLDNAIESARQLACLDLGGSFNATAIPACQLNNLLLTGGLSAATVTAGSATFAGAVQAFSFQYTSDRRLKHDITNLNTTLGSLAKLRPVHFRWNKEASTSSREDVGFIAQEVQEVFPDVVFENPDKKTVDYIRLTPYLVKAIQEQQQEINQLKARIETYEKKKIKK